jgi:topoisomerase-4 subunit A
MSDENQNINEEELNEDLSENSNDNQEHDDAVMPEADAEFPGQTDSSKFETITKVTGMYKEWFLEYASYVILERAVPSIRDGFKPVQRRIMQSMKDLDDGRYNKVANLVGHTMQYHPHGDASIGDAMVQLGQKDILIDTQGNWGNILTGDGAAAPRYIEARLSKFATEVVFNPKTTVWQATYDGRRKEPVDLPVKFPLLLAQGVEGIAVGLSTKILPHNFNELIDASIKYLRGKPFTLEPDFDTAGIADVSDYREGMRGGKVRVRARISQLDKNTLVITEIPFGTNTSTLIDSILKANEKKKIKVNKVEDNTSAQVEILIHLPSGVSPDKTIDALYAFTDCELSVSPLCCVIDDNKPVFISVHEILKRSTDHTVYLLKRELEIELEELHEQWHFASLERIFIENRIYHDIEEEATWEGVLKAIDKGLQPHIQHLKRAITEDDIVRLTEIRIKRISKFDIDKAQQLIEALEGKIAEVKHHLENLIDFAVDYFKNLKTKYGKGRDRKTEIRLFDTIEASKVVMQNAKLYVNREEGFIGTGLKKDEFVTDCADIDDIIIFREDGKMSVTKISDKTFVGKGIIHVAVFKKNDTRTIYNLVYRDGKTGPSYMKRFYVSGITRDKEYDLTNGKPNSAVLYFTANANGEAEVITVHLRAIGNIKKLRWDLDFADLAIKSRTSKGNVVSKNSVKKIELKEAGVSTLKPRKIWYDETVMRLNVDERGELLGEFKPNDRLLIINQHGNLKTVIPDLSMHFDEDMVVLEKWIPNKPITVVYFDGERERYYLKRFVIENPNKLEVIISEHSKSQLEIVATDYRPMLEVIFSKKDQKPLEINAESFIEIKGINALGNLVTKEKIKQINALESLPYEEPNIEELEVDEELIELDTDEIIERIDEDESGEEPNIDDTGQISLF